MTEPRATDFHALLGALADEGVEFILVGGLAATAHGSTRLTNDVDVVYRRTRDNFARLVAALRPLDPYLRGRPAGLPFQWDIETITRGLNFMLTTSCGDLDLLGEIVGGGGYEDLEPDATRVTGFGVECLCLELPALIHVTRAAGRPQDLEMIAELEAILEEREARGDTA